MKADFRLKLPELDDYDTPESYLHKFGPMLKGKEGWVVRRYVTLTLLSFGKLLMYRDLDPANWPKGNKINNHPRIREFFEGIQNDEIQIATDYELDEPDQDFEVPQLIDNADSSQHSAIIDALQGRNLVIQGPPGTGKSQTITNLIASALVAGKSVLFVSEKLAALEVVRRRLDRAGLGMFCLELHSNKTKKDGLLKDVARRIDLRETFASPRNLHEKLMLLEEQKSQLRSYARLMATEFGELGLSIHEIFWRRERLRNEYGVGGSELAELSVPSPETFGLRRIERGRELAENYVLHLKNALVNDEPFSSEQLISHPWYGLTDPDLSFADQNTLIEHLQVSLDLAIAIESHCKEFAGEISSDPLHEIIEGPKTLRRIGDFVQSLDVVLKADLENIEAEALPALRSESMKEHVQVFVQDVIDFHNVEDELMRVFGQIVTLSDEERVEARAAALELNENVAEPVDLRGAIGLSSEARAKAGELERAMSVFGEVCQALALKLPNNLEGFGDLVRVLNAIESCPLDLLHRRHAGLEALDAVGVINRAMREAEPIKQRELRLAEVFDLSLCPDSSTVAGHVSACANAGFLRLFDRQYRAARRAYRAAARDARRPSKDTILRDFRDLLEYQNKKQQFAQNSRYGTVFEGGFDGIYTDFEDYLELTLWLNRTREIMHASPQGSDLTTHIWELSSSQLRRYSGDTLIAAREPLARAGALLLDARRLLRTHFTATEKSDLAVFHAELLEAAESIERSAGSLLSVHFPESVKVGDLEGLLAKVGKLQALRQRIDNDDWVSECFAHSFAGTGTDTDRIVKTIRTFSLIDASSLPRTLQDYLLSAAIKDRVNTSRIFREELVHLSGALLVTLREFQQLGQVSANAWCGTASFDSAPIPTVASRAERGLKAQGYLKPWVLYLQARQQFADESWGSNVIQAVERGAMNLDKASTAFEFSVFHSLVSQIFATFPEIERFSGLTQTKLREKFSQLDRQCLELYRKQAANIIDARPIPYGNGTGPVGTFSEAALLLHEISKQRRHIPIRQLIHRAGRALQALKPCFMMGPLSVAQYLAPGSFHFDYVVMDEASQLKPEDALGAIARGAQIIVVGDRKQLPPTSFFDRLDDPEENESEDSLSQTLEDSESILDVANAVYQPARMLRWHYRSRHGSLIAFSNREFYDGNLIVFPSPDAKSEKLGVRLRLVENGVFSNRRNIPEADEVVSSVIRQVSREPDLSVGVVAMNIAQKDLLEDLFFKELKENAAIEAYLERTRERGEPFFIKNLENVQGDERDVILISMTYGPNEQGRLLQRFGPINSATGHRRLNVLFTRARSRVDVFSSMAAERIVVGPESSAGVKALKAYLDYARTGILETAQFSGREPDSDFEVEVASAVKELGFDSVAQVGVAGFFIDLAVVHPTIPDTFILGIECDGASYHSSRSARDRDRLREEVLNDLGWKLHRVWSVDWYHDRAGEMKKIQAAIKRSFGAWKSTGLPSDASEKPQHHGN